MNCFVSCAINITMPERDNKMTQIDSVCFRSKNPKEKHVFNCCAAPGVFCFRFETCDSLKKSATLRTA